MTLMKKIVRIGELVLLPLPNTEERDTDESKSDPLIFNQNQVLTNAKLKLNIFFVNKPQWYF